MPKTPVAGFKRINMYVAPNVHLWFKNRSEQTGVAMSGLMMLALEDYVLQRMLIPHVPEMMEEMKRSADRQAGRLEG